MSYERIFEYFRGLRRRQAHADDGAGLIFAFSPDCLAAAS